MPRPSDFRWPIVVAAAASVLFFSRMLVRVDPDVFFHLKDGGRVLSEWRVPTVETDSYTRAGADMVAMEWLSSAAFAGAYRVGGYRLIAALSALLIFGALAALIVTWREGPADAPWPLLVALAAFGLVNFSLAKVQNFSFLFFAVFIFLIQRWEKGDSRATWFMAALLIPWANLHGGFILGWVILGGACGLDFIRFRRAWDLAPWAAGTFACFSHPDGVRAFVYPIWFFFAAPPTRRSVLEWTPIGLQFKNIPYVLIAATAAAARIDRMRARWPWGGMVLVFLILSLRTAKMLPFFTLSACAAAGLTPELAKIKKLSAAISAALLASICAIVLAEAREMRFYGSLSDWTREYPRVALEHWIERDFGRRLFHHYDWGAYLLWAMPEGGKVFIDGRLEPYWTLIPDYETLMDARPGWRALIDKYRIETALLPIGSPLTRALGEDRAWRAVGDDGRAVLFEKKTERSAPLRESK